MTTFQPPEDETPDEESLPPKPQIEDMPPEEGDAPPSDEEETDVADGDFLDDESAAGDDTIDNEEGE